MARLTTTHRQVAHWLATGATGDSSMTMALWLAFGERFKHASHPLDPADLNQCLQLLEVAPQLRARLGAMRGLSTAWTALVARWDEVEQCFLDEVGLGWTKAGAAPRTYALMKEVMEESDPGYEFHLLSARLRAVDGAIGPERGR